MKVNAHTRGVLTISIVLLVLVSLIHATSWRENRMHVASPMAEPFEVVSSVEMNIARHPKSQFYAEAALKHFYSDGLLVNDNAMFFSPTTNDIICQLGSESVSQGCEVGKSRLHAVSCKDITTMLKSAYDCSRATTLVAREPLNRDDCKVRVMDGFYDFNKSCVSAPVTVVSDTSMSMGSTAYGTRVFVMSRPCFLVGPLSKLYTVLYDGGAPGSQTMSDFDSSRSASLQLQVAPITDNRIWNPTEGLGMQEAAKILRGHVDEKKAVPLANAPVAAQQPTVVVMPVTMYYLNYVRPIPELPADTRANPKLNVITLYFPASSLRGKSGQLFSLPGQKFVITLAIVRGEQALVVQTDAAAEQYIPVLQDGMVVVTYTTTLLLMASFNRRRVCFKRFGGQPMLNVPRQAAINAATQSGPAPNEVYPYDNASVPNFADVAIKAGLM